MVADGASYSNADALTINPASFSDCEFELTSDTYAKGETPKIAKITLDGVDVTDDFADGEAALSFSSSNAGSPVIGDITAQPAGTYYTWLNASTISSGNIASGSGVGPVEFKLTDATAPAVAFANATALEGIDQDGKAVEADEKGAFSVVAVNDKDIYVIPTSVMPEGGKNAVDVELAGGDNLADSLYVKSNGDYVLASTEGKDIQDAGKYYVAVTASDESSVYAGAICYVPLTVKAFAYDTVTVFNKDTDNDGTADKGDVEDTTFVYDGAILSDLLGTIGVAVDGNVVTYSNAKVYAANGKEVASNEIVSAGTYTFYAEVSDTPVETTFTVEKLDLSKAVVAVPDAVEGSTYNSVMATVKVNNVALADKADGVSDIAGVEFSISPAMTKVGAYKATVSAAADQSNVTGSAVVDFNVVTEDVSNKLTITEGRGTIGNGSSETYAATGAGVFDASLLGLRLDGEELDADQYTVTVQDSEGNVVESGFKSGEAYTVTLRLVVDDEFSKGGSRYFTFTVADGSIAADCDVTVTYKGDVVEGVSADYTGKNVIDDVAVAVKDGKKVLTEGTEYELVLKNAKGEVVEEAVESGLYTLEVRGLTYSGSVSIPIVVGDMQVTELRVQPSDMGVIAWTGEAVTPVIEYTLDSQAKIDAGTAEWTVLPSDFYVAKYENAKTGKAVSEVVDEGDYKVTITPSTKIENMTLPAENVLEFAVSKTVAGFVDVSTSAWYANVVAKANTLEYMTGISGTAMFAPNATITRAEVAEVFAKMAGLELDKDKTYPTKFSDVEADAWFAQSVAWASQAGIVGGYEGTDLFGSFDNATREQVATMIYRYAAVAGLDTSVEDEAKALSAYADADQLTFGKTAMAWCVEQGVFGVDTDVLNPLANMSRAEMAATAVRVQPEAIA